MLVDEDLDVWYRSDIQCLEAENHDHADSTLSVDEKVGECVDDRGRCLRCFLIDAVPG